MPKTPFADVFFREDIELCTYFRFHQQKIAFFLTAMRRHADALRKAEYAVTYQQLDDPLASGAPDVAAATPDAAARPGVAAISPRDGDSAAPYEAHLAA